MQALGAKRLSNSGLLQSGANMGVALTRLERSLVTSLTYVAAGEEVARCRTLNRWAECTRRS